MNDLAKIMREQLAALQKEYIRQLPEREIEIEKTAVKICVGLSPEASLAILKDLHFYSHKLAGSGATYGFETMGTAAKDLETLCAHVMDQGDVNLDDCLLDLNTKIEKLLTLMDEATGHTKQANGEKGGGAEGADHLIAEAEAKSIVLFGQDSADTLRIVGELETFGFKARLVSDLAALEATLAQTMPKAIIYDNDCVKEEDKRRLAEILKEKQALDCPSVVISSKNEIHSRLEAVRFGVNTYLVKPFSVTYLIDTLDELTSSEDQEPFRVMIIDDDIATARYTDIVLQGAGMITGVMTNPLNILEKLDSFVPELILVDLYMPECSGIELAAVVRQQDAFAAIPIVFLSGEADLEKQLGAMRYGGDDFLTKPIKGEHLIGSVTARIKRFRKLRARMVRDALTGLLNHTTTNQFLEKEVSRVERNKDVLTFAMLDIDHFKSVNDTYGHGVGDRVIKSLARLLKQRLRGTDIIGRLGGEEFGAVLPGTSGENAKILMDSLREAFSEIEQLAEDQSFKVTLSVGIAEYPSEGLLASATAVREAADSALYYAKEHGRNKVILHGVDDQE